MLSIGKAKATAILSKLRDADGWVILTGTGAGRPKIILKSIRLRRPGGRSSKADSGEA